MDKNHLAKFKIKTKNTTKIKLKNLSLLVVSINKLIGLEDNLERN